MSLTTAATVTPPVDPGLARARRQAGATIAVLVGVAWASLLAWDASPQGRYLDHDALAESGLGVGATTLVFVGGWVLMLAAMMFPSTYSLVTVFSPIAERRGPRRRLVGALLGGYVAAWTCVGLLLLVADTGLHALVERSATLEAHPELIAAGALAGAGLFQLSSIKDRCLTVCRSTRVFVFTRWKGANPVTEAFVLGAEHGRFCIGCCIALMLVAFGLGAGNLGLMFVFGGLMAVEKLAPWGERLVRPTAAALLVAAVAVLAVPAI